MSRVRKCFKGLREVLPALLVLVASCKKASSSAAPPDAAVGVVDAGPVVEAGAVTTERDAGARRPVDLGLRIVRLAVSSRVDNETESPLLISDGNMETSWSSRTGELEGRGWRRTSAARVRSRASS